MSGQIRFLLGYEQMVQGLLAKPQRGRRGVAAVGGGLRILGVLEHALLRGEGLRDGCAIVDVGCGSGRLATQLRRYPACATSGSTWCRSAGLRAPQGGPAGLPLGQGGRGQAALPGPAVDFCVFFSVLTGVSSLPGYALPTAAV